MQPSRTLAAPGKVPRVFVARARTAAEVRALGLASTLEVTNAPRRRRAKKSPPPGTPWQPWKSFGLIGGALAATIAIAAVGLVEAIAVPPPLAVPSIAVPSTPISPALSSSSVAHLR